MSSSLVFRSAVTLLAFAVGLGFTYILFEVLMPRSGEAVAGGTVGPDEPSTLGAAVPDPLGRGSMPVSTFVFLAVLIVIAIGVLWLGRRRETEPEMRVEPEPEGPHLIFEREPAGRRRAPRFYEDLRRRETTLEGMESRGPDGQRREVIELPVGNQRPAGNNRSPRT